MKVQKNNIVLALLLSLITTIGGAVLFGLIYYIGYYIYYLTAAEIILACAVFFKFKEPKNWKIILLSILWGFVWSFVFNALAVIICEAIMISKEFTMSFADSYYALIELWKLEPEVTTYMNTRMIQIAAIMFISGLLFGTMYIVKLSKQIKLNKEQNAKIETSTYYTQIQEQPTQPNPNKLKEIYLNMLEACKSTYLIYLKDKNKLSFKENLVNIEQKYIQKLSIEEKNIIKTNLENKLTKTETSVDDKNIAKILLSIIK